MLVDAAGNETSALVARYKALGRWHPGIRRYNMFWQTFEVTESSSAAINCPDNATMVPRQFYAVNTF